MGREVALDVFDIAELFVSRGVGTEVRESISDCVCSLDGKEVFVEAFDWKIPVGLWTGIAVFCRLKRGGAVFWRLSGEVGMKWGWGSRGWGFEDSRRSPSSVL